MLLYGNVDVYFMFLCYGVCIMLLFLNQKQRFHISRSFSSDTCQGNRQNKECRAETAYKSAREKREVVSDWTKSVDQSKTEALVRDFQRVDNLLLPAQDRSRNFDVSGF